MKKMTYRRTGSRRKAEVHQKEREANKWTRQRRQKYKMLLFCAALHRKVNNCVRSVTVFPVKGVTSKGKNKIRSI